MAQSYISERRFSSLSLLYKVERKIYPIAFTSEINIIQTTQVLSEAKYAGRHKLPTLTAFYTPDKTDTIFKVTVSYITKYADRHKLPTLTAIYTPDKTDTTFKVTVQLLQNQIS